MDWSTLDTTVDRPKRKLVDITVDDSDSSKVKKAKPVLQDAAYQRQVAWGETMQVQPVGEK